MSAGGVLQQLQPFLLLFALLLLLLYRPLPLPPVWAFPQRCALDLSSALPSLVHPPRVGKVVVPEG